MALMALSLRHRAGRMWRGAAMREPEEEVGEEVGEEERKTATASCCRAGPWAGQTLTWHGRIGQTWERAGTR